MRPDSITQRFTKVRQPGFTLIELVMVILIIAVIAGITMRTLGRVFSNANYQSTVAELDVLAEAMVGNPRIVENNIRTNYGYVGDTGVLPPTLDDLVSNVSGIAGWAGPYIDIGFSDDPDYYKNDAYGNPYTYSIPSDPAQPPTITTPADGDSITRNVESSVNAILNNTVKVRLLNQDGIEVTGDEGTVAIEIGTTWYNFNYDPGIGFYLSTVPIGIKQLRAISATDTTYKSISIGPGNSLTGGTLEMQVFANYGRIEYVSGSTTVEGTGQNQVFFKVKNTGAPTFDINRVTLEWTNPTGNCWNCLTPYLSEFVVKSNTYWKWDTNGRTSRVGSGTQITLDIKLKVYTGINTIGPVIFEDAATGAASPIIMRESSFTVQFHSNTAATQEITFNSPGSCTPGSITYSSFNNSSNSQITFTIVNNGHTPVTIDRAGVTCNHGTSTFLEQIDIPAGTRVWQANQPACGSTPRVQINNIPASYLTLCFNTPVTIPADGGNRTMRLTMYNALTGTVGAGPFTGVNFTVNFDPACGSDQQINFTVP